MFKFVVCALFAVVAADPQGWINPFYTEVLSPATTTITRSASSVINSPYHYPYGIAHLIKKRAAPLLDTIVTPTAYLNDWVSPYSSYVNSYVPYSPIHYSHLIKKRSPDWISPLTYFAPRHLATSYSSGLVHDFPLVSSYVSPAHFIKKRSAAWIAPGSIASTYVASAPLTTTAVLPSTSYWSGYAGVYPFYKK
ncbi:uncharacterized protein [Battus philenor]|uniref:uncharacterized protein n=1 Tax=Battus philenor TaxID=42288 RepID=UPI0035D0059A